MKEPNKAITTLNIEDFSHKGSNSISSQDYIKLCLSEFRCSTKNDIFPSAVVDGEYEVGSKLYDFESFFEINSLFKSLIDIYNCFLFSGESGIGKSVFFRKLMFFFSEEYNNNRERFIPLYLDCNDYSENCSFDSWVNSVLEEKYNGFSFFQQTSDDTYYIVLIDSINKVKTNEKDNFCRQIIKIEKWMRDLLQKNNRIKFFVASEKNSFVVGLNSYFKRNLDLVQFYLQPLTEQKIEQLIEDSNLSPNDKSIIKNEIFIKYSSLSFIRLPFYVDKIIKAARIITNLHNHTMFIEYLLKITFSGSLFQQLEIDSLLEKAACLSAKNNKFCIHDLLLDNHNIQDLMQYCVNSMIIIYDELSDEYRFAHQIFQNYYLALYLKRLFFSVNKEVTKFSDILIYNSRVDNIDPIKHLFNMIDDNRKEEFLDFLMTSDLLIAANCVVESNNCKWKADIADRIIKCLLDDQTKTISLEERKEYGLLLGQLGDRRFSINNRVIEPPVIQCSENLFVGKFPITNLEYSMFLKDPDYLNNKYWSLAHRDAWFSDDTILGSVFEHWKNVQDYLNESLERVKVICGKNGFSKEQCACIFYFLKMDKESLKEMIYELYGNNSPIPLMWQNPEYNNPSLPVVGISIYEAFAYCEWLSYQTSKKYRLLTSDEWFLVSGGEKRIYPYGNKYNKNYSNTIESIWNSVLAVGLIPQNISSSGLYDMSGNIFEWTSSIWKPKDNPINKKIDTQYICRGGSWIQGKDRAMSNYIGRGKGWVKNIDLGFRVCYEI